MRLIPYVVLALSSYPFLQTEVNETNVIPVLNETVTLTEVNLTAADVIFIADILYNFLQQDKITPTVSLTPVFLVIYSA